MYSVPYGIVGVRVSMVCYLVHALTLLDSLSYSPGGMLLEMWWLVGRFFFFFFLQRRFLAATRFWGLLVSDPARTLTSHGGRALNEASGSLQIFLSYVFFFFSAFGGFLKDSDGPKVLILNHAPDKSK